LNYDEVLRGMKEAIAGENDERKKAGYEAIQLLGWAESPHYDKATNKLYWAKELKFGNDPDHTLNYNIRALGRRGVLVLNAVAAMDQLPSVRTSMQDVMGFVHFNEGHRYTDYIPGTDKLATYGIGALIAGKVAAKAGLLKVLVGVLVAAKKFIIVGVLALIALLKKLFGRKSEAETPPVAS
jgi:uncharacterized membrane-anchored protein